MFFSEPLLLFFLILFFVGLKFLRCPDAHINNCSIEQGTNLDWTRNKGKQEGEKKLAQIEQGTRKSKKKKKIVRRSAKSVPLWAVEILPLLCQITKIDSGICFRFCVWFCSWFFGARSGRKWLRIWTTMIIMMDSVKEIPMRNSDKSLDSQLWHDCVGGMAFFWFSF